MKALIYLREVEDVVGFANRPEAIEVAHSKPEDLSKVVEDLDIISAEVELENVTIDRLVKIIFALKSFEAIHYDSNRTLTIFCGNKDELLSVLGTLSDQHSFKKSDVSYVIVAYGLLVNLFFLFPALIAGVIRGPWYYLGWFVFFIILLICVLAVFVD